MAIVTIENLTIGFRGAPLLDNVTCQINSGQRIGLLGRNGAGKTTLLRLLAGDVEPDQGDVILQRDVRISLLPQDVPVAIGGTIWDVVSSGLPATDQATDEQVLWQRENDINQIISRMQLDGSAQFKSLSSGMKRRALIASALVSRPALLLLDEPTNHLDIEAIEWLEQFLLKWPAALMFVTHDRMFLRHLATRILEIDRGRIFDWSCDYDTFLVRKEQALAAEEKQNALFDKQLADEETWIRKGIKARRTRNEGRVRALKKMREERLNRRSQAKTSNLKIHEGSRSGTLVIEAKDIHFGYDGRTLIDGLSTTLMRGDKVGIIGPNGAGKTTLLKILLGEIQPCSGQVRQGSQLEIVYFDQLREQLDPEKSVQENVGDGSDYVIIGDQKKHIIGYLQEFLFTPERARTQVKFLSGGERNRILLAQQFAKPANVIVLDEPTNDLDTETLEMLEQRLVDFRGTVLVVSHDRDFLNNLVTSTLVFEHANVKEYVGGYDDWLRQRSDAEPVAKGVVKKSTRPKPDLVSSQPRKLKYKEKQELAQLPKQIEADEAEIAAAHQAMSDPAFYQQAGETIAEKQNQLRHLEESLAQKYARWDELETLDT